MDFKKAFLGFFFFFLLVLPLSFAQPPVVQEGDSLTVIYPKHDGYYSGVNLTLHFHVADSINRVMNNSEFDCFAHVYDLFGSHLLTTQLTNNANNFDVELFINNSINDVPKHIPFIVWCNTSTGGVNENAIEYGFISSEIRTTYNGHTFDENYFSSKIMIFGVGVLLFLFLFLAFKLSDEHFVLKLFLVILVIFLGILVPRIGFGLIADSVQSDLVIYYLRIIKIFVYYSVLFLLYKVFDYYGKFDGIKQFLKDKFNIR